MNLIVRQESKKDYRGITRCNDLAFKQKSEGTLVEAIRKNLKFIPELSLVAEVNAKIIGHILFFPIIIESNQNNFSSLSLAPMSVIPEYQNKGIGTELVKSGLEKAGELGFESVIVLGHERYYPRFGFKPASNWSIKPPFPVPDEAFMAIELIPDALTEVNGNVIYPKEYDVAL